MTARLASAALLVVLAFAAAGCGFALRGSAAVPSSLARTQVVADRHSARLVREIERQLAITGNRLVTSADGATAVLRIVEDDAGQRILSLTTTGGPEEYEVYHHVRFELSIDGERVYGPETVTLTRDYTFNKNDVLGKRREYDTLRRALERDIVSLMLRRLSLSPNVT